MFFSYIPKSFKNLKTLPTTYCRSSSLPVCVGFFKCQHSYVRGVIGPSPCRRPVPNQTWFRNPANVFAKPAFQKTYWKLHSTERYNDVIIKETDFFISLVFYNKQSFVFNWNWFEISFLFSLFSPPDLILHCHPHPSHTHTPINPILWLKRGYRYPPVAKLLWITHPNCSSYIQKHTHIYFFSIIDSGRALKVA